MLLGAYGPILVLVGKQFIKSAVFFRQLRVAMRAVSYEGGVEEGEEEIVAGGETEAEKMQREAEEAEKARVEAIEEAQRKKGQTNLERIKNLKAELATKRGHRDTPGVSSSWRRKSARRSPRSRRHHGAAFASTTAVMERSCQAAP